MYPYIQIGSEKCIETTFVSRNMIASFLFLCVCVCVCVWIYEVAHKLDLTLAHAYFRLYTYICQIVFANGIETKSVPRNMITSFIYVCLCMYEVAHTLDSCTYTWSYTYTYIFQIVFANGIETTSVPRNMIEIVEDVAVCMYMCVCMYVGMCVCMCMHVYDGNCRRC